MRPHRTLPAALLVIALIAPRALADGGTEAVPDPRWLDASVDAQDRAAAAQLLTWAVPAATPGVRWFGGEPADPSDGQVTVVQVFSMKEGGRSLIRKVRDSVPKGTRLVIVHAPVEVDRVVPALEKSPPAMPIAVDTDGAWLKAMGLDGSPVNLVVDVNGAVRYVGLRADALKKAITPLLQEKADPAKRAKPRPAVGTPKPPAAPADDASTASDFPVFREEVVGAIDRRGKKMPEFSVDQWVSPRPDAPKDKLLVIDFWATWCGPCVASIPHMNELAEANADIAQCVGVSSEEPAAFQQGLMRIGKSVQDFRYALALGPSRAMSEFFGIKGIPHCAVLSADGVVRWQGHPADLTVAVMKQLVQAQRAVNAGATSPPPGKGR